MISKELLAAITASGIFFVSFSAIMLIVSLFRPLNGKFWANIGTLGNMLVMLAVVTGFATNMEDPVVRGFFFWVATYLMAMGFTVAIVVLTGRVIARSKKPKALFCGTVFNTHTLSAMTFTRNKTGLYDIVLSQDPSVELIDPNLIVETTITIYRKS